MLNGEQSKAIAKAKFKIREDPVLNGCKGGECAVADVTNFSKKRFVYHKGTSQPHYDELDEKFKPVVAFSALGIITLIRIATQWQQKSIGYFFGFSGVGEMAGNKFFEISTAYPEMNAYYGLLVGLCYTLPYSVSGLFAGSVTKKGNRKYMMAAVIALMSCF